VIDPVSVGLAVILFGAGWVVGRVGRMRSRREVIRPICECGHHYGAHDDDGCNAEVQRHENDDAGYSLGQQWRPCACLKYTGPVPLDQFWAPPIANSE
jgi:hypothetical protein